MSNANRSETLSKIAERIYEQHLHLQHIIDSLLVDVCKEENVSSEMLFFGFFAGFYHNELF